MNPYILVSFFSSEEPNIKSHCHNHSYGCSWVGKRVNRIFLSQLLYFCNILLPSQLRSGLYIIHSLEQGSANFFSKGPDCKYFRFYQPHMVSVIYSFYFFTPFKKIQKLFLVPGLYKNRPRDIVCHFPCLIASVGT